MLWLLAHVIGGYARSHPLRAVVQVIAIAVGVALGYAVHLINASALEEFSAAVRQASGQADATVSGPARGLRRVGLRAGGGSPAVAWASPALDVEGADRRAAAACAAARCASEGVDILRSALLSPHTIGEPVDGERRFALLDDGIYLSPAALEALALAPGGDDRRAGPAAASSRCALPAGCRRRASGQLVAVMDLGFAQWRLDRLGRLTRIDVQFAAGSTPQEAAAQWQLPAGVSLQTAESAATRVSNLSRALPRQPERAGASGAVHRRLPRLLAAGTGGAWRGARNWPSCA